MPRSRTVSSITKSYELARELQISASSGKSVKGLTHTFYRYPARFSPEFARAAIKAFTKPGDLVLDPFMGGGTTLVEAYSLGRIGVGSDINSLAAMIAKVKTSLLSEADVEDLTAWSHRATVAMSAIRPHFEDEAYARANYLKHLHSRKLWRMKRILAQAIATTDHLHGRVQRNFARCVILTTAQWALDCRADVPRVDDFRLKLLERTQEMLAGSRELRESVEGVEKATGKESKTPRCLFGSAARLPEHFSRMKLDYPNLILTSPPYPGVHVLYHRWQFQSRKEMAVPYWIADCLDGTGASHYTFGDRHEPGLTTYFEETFKSFSALRQICSRKTIVIQMIAFSQPDWQLPKYLQTMNEAGFSEFVLRDLAVSPDGRLWRSVPNRKWYAIRQTRSSAAHEIVLFHKAG